MGNQVFGESWRRCSLTEGEVYPYLTVLATAGYMLRIAIDETALASPLILLMRPISRVTCSPSQVGETQRGKTEPMAHKTKEGQK